VKNISKYSDQIGGFAGKYDNIIASCDGVGTKILLAQLAKLKYNRSVSSIGIDCVAMVVNDLLCKGAIPLFFLDYFASANVNEEDFNEILEGIYDGCQQSGMKLLGGETAELPGIIEKDTFDVCGFGVGQLPSYDYDSYPLPKELPRNNINKGDVAIGLLSSGFHSNGFTIIRKYATPLHKFNDDLSSWLDQLLVPTKIYVNDIRVLEIAGVSIKALAHITGGGFNNVKRVLPDNIYIKYTDIVKYYAHQNLFQWIQNETKFTVEEMRATFNCGIGMIAIISKGDIKKIENTNLDWVFLGKVDKF
jgi:phosphoribosylformylglycinamidine cyclo-ligase